MDLFEKLARWLGLQNNTSTDQTLRDFQDALERGRRFKRRGKYAEALQELQTADNLAQNIHDKNLPVLVALNRVEIYIRQSDFKRAEEALLTLKQDSGASHERAQMAYIVISQGVLAQDQNDWETARTLYEQALALAREIHSPGAEGRARGYLADTYLHEGNASFAVHLLQESLTKLNQSGDIELSSYFVGRLGEALIQTGQKSEGEQLLGRALRLAEHMQYKEYELLWRKALAIHAMGEGHYPEAKRHFMLVLTQIEKDTADYVLILCRLSKACMRLGEEETALEYAQQAEATVSAFSVETEAYLISKATLGIALRATGKNAEAITHLAPSVALYRDISPSVAEYSYVDVLRNLAAAQTETKDYAQAEHTFEQALDYARTHDSPLELAGAYRDLGILKTHAKDYSEAIKIWTSALEIYEAQSQYANAARLYCDIANLRKQIWQGRRAMKDYEKALMLLSSVDDLDARGVILANAATAYVDYGDIETAESFFVESIKIALKLHDRKAEATRRGNYGWFLMYTGRAQRSLATLSYALRQSENLNLTLQMAVQTDNTGLAHDELGNFDEAVIYHRQALHLVEPLNNSYWQASITVHLAQSFISQGKINDAHPLLEQILAANHEDDNIDINARLLIARAKIHLLQQDFESGMVHIQKAVELAERTGMRRLVTEALTLRSQYYANVDRIDEAAQDWEKVIGLYNLLQMRVTKTPNWLSEKQVSG